MQLPWLLVVGTADLLGPATVPDAFSKSVKLYNRLRLMLELAIISRGEIFEIIEQLKFAVVSLCLLILQKCCMPHSLSDIQL